MAALKAVIEISPGFVVVGYGKLGGIELGYKSDLDLVFLHRGQLWADPGRHAQSLITVHFMSVSASE